jgi:hypothetical protein
MTFLWPEMLWMSLALPLLVLAYLWVLLRKKKLAVKYANLSMVREAMGAGGRIRRHVPPLLFLLALAAMLVAMARPQATITLPTQHETVILAMDISGSMRATDVEPNRLVAAQNAAKQFVNEQPENVRVGVVAFAGTATVAQAPTATTCLPRSTASSSSAPPRSAARSSSRSPRSSRTKATTWRASPTAPMPRGKGRRTPRRRSPRRRDRTPRR